MGVFSILQSNQKFYHIYTVTIIIHKSRNLIGTVGIAKFMPKYGQVFQSNIVKGDFCRKGERRALLKSGELLKQIGHVGNQTRNFSILLL